MRRQDALKFWVSLIPSYITANIYQQSVTYSKCYGYTHGSHVLAGTMLTDNEYALVFIEMFIVTINGYTFKTISSVLQFHVQLVLH